MGCSVLVPGMVPTAPFGAMATSPEPEIPFGTLAIGTCGITMGVAGIEEGAVGVPDGVCGVGMLMRFFLPLPDGGVA